MHADQKPCVVIVRHDISPSVIDAEGIVNHVLSGCFAFRVEKLLLVLVKLLLMHMWVNTGKAEDNQLVPFK